MDTATIPIGRSESAWNLACPTNDCHGYLQLAFDVTLGDYAYCSNCDYTIEVEITLPSDRNLT